MRLYRSASMVAGAAIAVFRQPGRALLPPTANQRIIRCRLFSQNGTQPVAGDDHRWRHLAGQRAGCGRLVLSNPKVFARRVSTDSARRVFAQHSMRVSSGLIVRC